MKILTLQEILRTGTWKPMWWCPLQFRILQKKQPNEIQVGNKQTNTQNLSYGSLTERERERERERGGGAYVYMYIYIG